MENEIQEMLPERKKPSEFLKALTILTFIGCAFALYSAISGYINGEKQIVETEKGLIKMEESGMSETWIKSTKDSLIILEQRNDNKLVFLLIDLLAIGLCAYGALQMRKLQKIGYYSWLAGELLPILLGLVMFGSLMLNVLFIVIMIIPVAFIIMYTSQLKHME